jgi:hypothetical protein
VLSERLSWGSDTSHAIKHTSAAVGTSNTACEQRVTQAKQVHTERRSDGAASEAHGIQQEAKVLVHDA